MNRSRRLTRRPTKKKIGIAVRGQKGAADARTDRRRSNRSTLAAPSWVFLRARSRARRHWIQCSPPTDVVMEHEEKKFHMRRDDDHLAVVPSAPNPRRRRRPSRDGRHRGSEERRTTLYSPSRPAPLQRRLRQRTSSRGADVNCKPSRPFHKCRVDDKRRRTTCIMTRCCAPGRQGRRLRRRLVPAPEWRTTVRPLRAPGRPRRLKARPRRAAGSWRAYERRFHRGTLPRFRSLVVRGRATVTEHALLVALAHLPHRRPFRAVLAFGP